MRSKSPEKRGRQKVVCPPTYRVENEYNPEAMPQYFQISVNVLKAKRLVWSNPHSANSYVLIVLGKKKHRTNIRRHMKEPCYRESFVFELFTTVNDLKQTNLWLAVMEPRFCVLPHLLGEASIDLGAIWSQPYHQTFHKWVQLLLPRDWATGPGIGYLQLDVSIIYRAEGRNISPLLMEEKLQDKFLLHSDAQQQCANYIITVYAAFGLPNSNHSQNDKLYSKSPNTFVKVSFCGLVAKTGIIHHSNNPIYSEQISIVEMFPNMCPAVRFEVCSADRCFQRILSCTQLNLAQVSHDGENGFLPTFGPSIINMYGATSVGSQTVTGEEGPYHRGALVIALRTLVPYYQQGIKSVVVEPVPPINLCNIWPYEDFCIFCPIFEVSMLDQKIAGRYSGVAITFGEIPSDDSCDAGSRKLHYTGILEVYKNGSVYGYIDFSNSYPVLQYATRLPDFRCRMYRNNMIYRIYKNLIQSLNEIQQHLKNIDYCNIRDLEGKIHTIMDDTAGRILKFVDFVHSAFVPITGNCLTQYNTELDLKQMELQVEEIERIHQQITRNAKGDSFYNTQKFGTVANHLKKNVKAFVAEAQIVAQHLKGLICKNLEGWPDIVLWLLNNGSRVAFAKISATDVVHSVIPEQSGKYSGRIQTIFLKPLTCLKHVNSSKLSCYCVVGKVELQLWMGLYSERSAFGPCLPRGYKLRVKDYIMFIKSNVMLVECRAFIYKAKLNSDAIGTIVNQTFVRINALNSAKDTEFKCKTLLPIWNQVIKINRIVFMPRQRLLEYPPIVLVEVNNIEISGKTELIGRIRIRPAVSDEQSYENAPNLQWYDLYRGSEFCGQILMSVQLLEIREKIRKNTIYTPEEETYNYNTAPEAEVVDRIEPLPNNLLPKSSSYKVDIYWWGLRDVNAMRKPCVVMEIEDLSIKSEIITEMGPNSNFPNGRTTQVFKAYLNEAYCLPLSINLYDVSTFGRSLYLGTNVVKNPSKYMIEWLPEAEREAYLKRVSISSPEFIQVNKLLFIKRSSQLLREDNYSSKTSIKSLSTSKTGLRKWTNLFRKKELDEEKYTLLPIFTNKIENNFAASNSNTRHKDWWFRYLCSQKDYIDEDSSSTSNTVDKLIIYESELETQPEFSKFKDWCATLKLYNGKKTGIPDKDEKLYCGFLKAGFAIYKWPPPTNTITVTASGIDLNRGFFDDHPENEPAEFLIRVYIVKGLNLKTKEFTGKTNPYVVLSCGNKNISNRNSYVSNSLNPIIGQVHEVRCCLPDDYLLAVSLYDYEICSPDKLIGTTTIDLEDRIYSKHRARVGLSLDYNLNGPFKWRDYLKPSEILEEICTKNHLSPPEFINSNTLIVNGVEYRNSEKDKSVSSAALRGEKLCLNILHKWHTLPICGYSLVPEHVETRTLYDPNKPGIEQGKILLWVDIFPLETGIYIPPPINITPREAEDYELRLTVYSVRILMSDIDNIGRKSSDIYVRAWIGSANQSQNTDVHYQCYEGNAKFNWRMIFNFKYEHADRKLVVKEKGLFTEYGDNVPPVLVVQVLDNEESSANEDLGKLVLNLNALPRGVKQAQDCTLDTFNSAKKIDLFCLKSLRNWWPLCINDYSSGELLLTGSIHLELMLLPVEKAILMPMGVGREPPFPLPEPLRREFAGRLSEKVCRWKTKYCDKKYIPVMFMFIIFLLILFVVIYFQLSSIILDYFDLI